MDFGYHDQTLRTTSLLSGARLGAISLQLSLDGVPIAFPTGLDGGLDQSLGNLARQRFPDATVGVVVGIPLGYRAAKAEVATADSAQRQIARARDRLEMQIAVEVRNAVTAVATAAKRIRAARASRDAAAIELQAEEDRYRAGLTTPFFVLTRQNDLVTAQLEESAALATSRRSVAEFARAQGTLLRDRGIAVTGEQK